MSSKARKQARRSAPFTTILRKEQDFQLSQFQKLFSSESVKKEKPKTEEPSLKTIEPLELPPVVKTNNFTPIFPIYRGRTGLVLLTLLTLAKAVNAYQQSEMRYPQEYSRPLEPNEMLDRAESPFYEQERLPQIRA